jgi:hypothetical protein
MNQFVGYSNIIPLLAPVDITTTVTATRTWISSTPTAPRS